MRINVQDLTEDQPYCGTVDPAMLVCDGDMLAELLEPTFTCDPLLGQDREAVRLARLAEYEHGSFGGPQLALSLDSLVNVDLVRENHVVAQATRERRRYRSGDWRRQANDASTVSVFDHLMADGGMDDATEHDAQQIEVDGEWTSFSGYIQLLRDELTAGLMDASEYRAYVASVLFKHGAQIVGNLVYELDAKGNIRIEMLGANETPAHGAMAQEPAHPEGEQFGDNADEAYSGAAVRKQRTHPTIRPDGRILKAELKQAELAAISDLIAYAEPLVTADGEGVLWDDPDLMGGFLLSPVLEEHMQSKRDRDQAYVDRRNSDAIVWDDQRAANAFAQQYEIELAA